MIGVKYCRCKVSALLLVFKGLLLLKQSSDVEFASVTWLVTSFLGKASWLCAPCSVL